MYWNKCKNRDQVIKGLDIGLVEHTNPVTKCILERNPNTTYVVRILLQSLFRITFYKMDLIH